MAPQPTKLITAFGPPSRFTRFSVSILKKALSVSSGSFDDVNAVEVSQLRRAWEERQHGVFFLYSDCPERSIVDTYLKTKAPVILILDDPACVTSDVIGERGLEPDWAFRLTEQSLTILADLIQSSQSLIIRRDESYSLYSFLKSIFAHFNMNIMDTDCAAIAAQIAQTMQASVSDCIGALADRIYPETKTPSSIPDKRFAQHLEDQFERLRRISAGQSIHEIVWPVEMFLASADHKAPFRGAVELLGPPKCLAYGPYLHVPAGHWVLEARIIVENCSPGTKIIFDLYQSQVIVSNTFGIPNNGQLTLHATFDVIDPRIPYQLRLITAEGNIEGSLAIHSARLMRRDSPS